MACSVKLSKRHYGLRARDMAFRYIFSLKNTKGFKQKAFKNDKNRLDSKIGKKSAIGSGNCPHKIIWKDRKGR